MPIPITSRPAQLAALLAASFGGPYAYYNLGPSNQPVEANTRFDAQGRLISTSSAPVQITNPAIRDLRQFVRFDVTPGWVTSNFPRVSTVLANVQMDGLRVPVVTGTGSTDFAGTVDYYFDRVQQVRRIVLEGYCGDPAGLSATLLQFYGLQPEPSLGGHLYVSRWNNRVTSLSMFQPAPIMTANDPYSRFSVYIELNQPSAEYGLSEKSEQILQNSWQNLRWQ